MRSLADDRNIVIKKVGIALHGKPYFLFPNALRRWSFQKIALEHDCSGIIGKDDISFSRKYDLTP